MTIILGSNYRASGPPVKLPVSEATADANTLVWEMTGSANANETGVGGGFSGADLVLTQAGSIGAASSGYRAVDGAQKFACTAAVSAAIFGGDEWTFASQYKSLVPAFNEEIACLLATGVGITPYFGTSDGVAGNVFTRAAEALWIPKALTNTTSASWFCIWRKGGLVHAGFIVSDTMPTGWDSFPAGQRVCMPSSALGALTWTTNTLVGAYASAGAQRSQGTVVLSKLGLTAAV